MKPVWELHGYAIVCENGCIADAAGRLPPALQNDADWAYFQAELDRAVLCVLGRDSHEATPNRANRLRAVMTSRPEIALTQVLERVWFWNPQEVSLDEMLARLAPSGGRVAVPGGQGPFTHFLARFDAFHLSRKAGVALRGGTPCFLLQSLGHSPEELLSEAGMVPGPTQDIDPKDGVTLTVWSRPQSGVPS